ncbi:MAG: Zn-ribbon domain-containing OB-fold protein [Chloroflexi bacterium]|nr:Zn-ribbon domain-containing OB-fold protein [Chloroflexota bacterium]MBU1751275.1 Zn-ribbon domain-containing OB-fold protein [Chloroflexota bacterium]MBU1879609.1 Zn-ribbon domain-containing OB-fold protein [Chloroflexota bacterium]
MADKMEETFGGYILHSVPFPTELDQEALANLKKMTPILIEQPYSVTYLHSYAQDSPFFAGLAAGHLLVSREPDTGYTYATPRGHDMYTGQETDWVEIPAEGTVHGFTVCHFGSEEFLPECPFVLAQIEFPGVNTLFLGRLIDVDPHEATLDWIGMKVKGRFRRLSKFKPTDVYFYPA